MSSSNVLAGPPGDCCFTGFKHTGTASGTKVSIANIPTYLSKPPSSKVKTSVKPPVILFCSDVYGPFHLNNQLVQDYFASHGFIVLGIDYFLGDSYLHAVARPEFDRDTWVIGSRKQALEIFPKWLEGVRAEYGEETKYASVGYCFGGTFVLELAATDKIVAAAVAHPAFLLEEHFAQAKKPLLLSCAEDDFTFSLDSRRQAEDILKGNSSQYCFQVFSGVSHGFAVRGDPKEGDTRWAKEESARGIINWFMRFSQ
ncbi:Alpha/Beta hydrolase protein [Mycena floridula]|nr:Alpha/Beta hydrolase protein [Mycena floridula]